MKKRLDGGADRILSSGFGESAGLRGSWIWDREKSAMIPVAEYQKRTEVHNVIQDTFKVPVSSMASPTGEVFESKSAYRKHLKENGFRESAGEHLKDVMRLEFEALRNKEKAAEDRRREAIEDTQKIAMDIKYDRIPISEQDKAIQKKEAEKWGKDYWLKVTA